MNAFQRIYIGITVVEDVNKNYICKIELINIAFV